MVGKREKYDSRQPSYWWQDKSYDEIVEHAKTKSDIAILPIGSIEMHGSHCPTGHDTYQLFPMLEKVAERTGALLLPPLWYGGHPHHHWGFPGTIPLQNHTLNELLKDIVRGAKVAGINKVIFFYGHGQAFVTNYAVQELGREGYYVLSVQFQNMVKDIHKEIFETPFWHADEAETSIGMYAFGEFIDMSRCVDENGEQLHYVGGTPLLDRKFVQAPTEAAENKPLRFDEGTVSTPEWGDLKYGVIGDPSLATYEKGEAYCNAISDRLSELVEAVQKQFPVGVSPKTSLWNEMICHR